MQRRVYLPLILLLAGSLLFSGCTSRYGEQKTKVNHYPQCYEPVAQLRKDETAPAKARLRALLAVHCLARLSAG
jgi:hypothetical protein